MRYLFLLSEQRATFAEAEWCILPPVGGISIYEQFKLVLHPIRLQIHTVLGAHIMEYIWPNRGSQTMSNIAAPEQNLRQIDPWAEDPSEAHEGTGASLSATPGPGLSASRSFGDLKATLDVKAPMLKRSRSFNSSTPKGDRQQAMSSAMPGPTSPPGRLTVVQQDALEMRHRSLQKTFIRVEVAR